MIEFLEEFFSKNVKLKLNHYANVITIGNKDIAFCTDGVGTKIQLAKELNYYNNIGIDCVAMNVNDLICVGATPKAFVDYIAIQNQHDITINNILSSLLLGCQMANIDFVGGETAILPDIGIDLSGSAIGIVEDYIIDGKNITDGDILIGFNSNGLHANGFSVALKVLDELSLDAYIDGVSLGEELLQRTYIYCHIINRIKEIIYIKGIFHITGGGFNNLLRLNNDVGYVIDYLPDMSPIFEILSRYVSYRSMFDIFNMGIGLIIVIDEKDYNKLENYDIDYHKIGYVTKDFKNKFEILV